MLITRFVEGIFDRTYGYRRGARTTRKIAESVCVTRGRVHSDSEGYLPDTISHSLSARSRREGPESMATREETSGDNP